MITVEQARALGWQRVEFNDGLGFRPCTAVCAWNPEFQYRAALPNQIKFEDLPLGASLRHKHSVLASTEYEFRGVNRSTSHVYAERRTNDFVRLESYPRSSWYLSPDQSWLALGIDIPKGLVTQRHPNGYWWRIVRLEEGYELV